MKVYVFPVDMTGCGKYRVIWPTQALVDQGYDVQIVLPQERAEFLQVRQFAGVTKNVVIPEDADVIVLQRVTHNLIVEAIPMIQAKGVAVVMDVDDDLNRLHERHPAKIAFSERQDHDWRNTAKVGAVVAGVVVSTDALDDTSRCRVKTRTSSGGVARCTHIRPTYRSWATPSSA